MGDISQNFSRSEFACKCGCGFATVDSGLLLKLEALRSKLGGRPVRITSGCRCPKHSVAVGGYSTDAHTKGIAADITVDGRTVEDIAEAAELVGFTGIGLMNGAVHVDVRSASNYYNAHWFGDERTGETVQTFIRTKKKRLKITLDGATIYEGDV